PYVDRHDHVELAFVDLCSGREGVDASVVDEHLDAAVADRQRLLRERPDAVHVGKVRRYEFRLAARAADAFDRLVATPLVTAADDDLSTPHGELPGSLPADTAGTARDECGLVGKVLVHDLVFPCCDRQPPAGSARWLARPSGSVSRTGRSSQE